MSLRSFAWFIGGVSTGALITALPVFTWAWLLQIQPH